MRAREPAIAIGVLVWLSVSQTGAQQPARLGSVDRMATQGRLREAGIEARLIGESLQREGRYAEAIAALERSSELLGSQDPGWRASRQELAETYDLAGMPDRAESEWNALVEHFNSQSDLDREIRREILAHLASHYANRGDRTRATKTYLEVVNSVGHADDCDFFVERACRELIREFSTEGDYARAADASRALVGCMEVEVAQVPSRTGDLLAALQDYSRFAELTGRLDEAEGARARAAELGADQSNAESVGGKRQHQGEVPPGSQ